MLLHRHMPASAEASNAPPAATRAARRRPLRVRAVRYTGRMTDKIRLTQFAAKSG